MTAALALLAACGNDRGDEPISGPQQFQPRAGGDISDVYVGGTVEGYTQVLVGIDDIPVPSRVFALTDPARLVVDLRYARTDWPGGSTRGTSPR